MSYASRHRVHLIGRGSSLVISAVAMATLSVGAHAQVPEAGSVANLLISPTLLDFGFQPLGTESATRTITIRNPNATAVSLPLDASFPTSDFARQGGGSCDTISANGTCSYQIEFTPQMYNSGIDNAIWTAPVGVQSGGTGYVDTTITLAGAGTQDGAASLLTLPYNEAAISYDGAPVPDGGLDGYGNAYSQDFLDGEYIWSGQIFYLAYGAHSAVHQATIPLPTGQYFGATLLATGVNGNQTNQTFTVTYADGTSSLLHQSLSDWKTPQHYLGESIADSTTYRLNAEGGLHTGPYFLYAYTLPLDHTKTAVSLTLPNNPNVAVLAVNVGVAGVPVTVDLTSLYNVTAVVVDGDAVTGGGIDQHSTAISLDQLNDVPLNELLLAIPRYNQPGAVANLTVPLPAGLFSTLHLDGMAVEGNEPNQTLTINYQDGSSAVLSQSFSDWHTSQKYPHESIAVAMAYKLNPDGSKHAGTYDLYQYDIPIDATKVVSSVVLPKTQDVVILSVALKP